MPRLARLDAPGVLHHIMIRGIERRKIFRDHKDREDFLQRLAKLLPETNTACHAWVFIPSHAHFLFRSGKVPLSTLMKRLLTGYVVSFNRRHNRPCQSSLTGQAWPTLSLRGVGSTLRPVSPTGWKRSRRQNRYPN